MKRILLVLFCSSLYAPPLTIHFQNKHRNNFPAPVKTHVDALKRAVPNVHLRYVVAAVAVALAATDNRYRDKFLELVRSVQRYCNKANEVTRDAHTLEMNIRSWSDVFKKLT